MSLRGATVCLLGVSLGLAACGRTNRAPDAEPAGTGNEPPAHAGGASSSGGKGSAGGGSALECEEASTPKPGPSPLGHLDHAELNNTVRALLPAGSGAGLPWLDELGYDLLKGPLPPSTVGSLHELAHAVALELTEGVTSAAWLGECDVAARGEDACRDALAEPLLQRAYRRPLNDVDRQEVAEDFAMGRELGGDFESGMRAVIEVALQSPEFVYLVEQGNGRAAGGVVELTGYESAARLSYFLTAAPPDDELWSDAEQGSLSQAQLAAHAERLLGSAGSRFALSRFYARHVSVGRPSEVPDLGFDTGLAADVEEASRRFVEDVFFTGAGTFGALLTEPSAWTNAALASYYGYPAPAAGWQKVELDPAERGGVFTQPAFLATSSHGRQVSSIQRGVGLLRRALCYEVPPPPAGIVDIPEPPPAPATERQRTEAATKSAACSECHVFINPVGFAFGHYDAVGRWRDTDDGAPVDASGNLDRTDAAGTFTDAIELMERLADSEEAKSCFVRLWSERARRRPHEQADACSEAALTRAFSDGDARIVDLLVDLATTDTFRYRLESELPIGAR